MQHSTRHRLEKEGSMPNPHARYLHDNEVLNREQWLETLLEVDAVLVTEDDPNLEELRGLKEEGKVTIESHPATDFLRVAITPSVE